MGLDDLTRRHEDTKWGSRYSFRPLLFDVERSMLNVRIPKRAPGARHLFNSKSLHSLTSAAAAADPHLTTTPPARCSARALDSHTHCATAVFSACPGGIIMSGCLYVRSSARTRHRAFGATTRCVFQVGFFRSGPHGRVVARALANGDCGADRLGFFGVGAVVVCQAQPAASARRFV